MILRFLLQSSTAMARGAMEQAQGHGVNITANIGEDFEESHYAFAVAVTKHVMARFGAAPSYFQDYLSAAYSGLVDAATRYDPSSEVPFERFAYLRVRGSIIDHIRMDAGRSAYEYKAYQVMKAVDEIADDFRKRRSRFDSFNVDQTLAEVLEYTSRGGLVFRLNYLEHEEEITEQTSDQRCAEEQMIFDEANAALREIIKNLPDAERAVIEGYYFEGLSFREIATDRLNVTRSWVSRVHVRALEAIKRELAGHVKIHRKRGRRRTNVEKRKQETI